MFFENQRQNPRTEIIENELKKLEKSDRKYVLIVGTFHPNGYFRKRCMEALAKEKGERHTNLVYQRLLSGTFEG